MFLARSKDPSKKYCLVLRRNQIDPRVALKQWLNNSSANPVDIECPLIECMHPRDGHNHITDCAELHDVNLFARIGVRFQIHINPVQRLLGNMIIRNRCRYIVSAKLMLAEYVLFKFKNIRGSLAVKAMGTDRFGSSQETISEPTGIQTNLLLLTRTPELVARQAA
jgi:hypothetical protein